MQNTVIRYYKTGSIIYFEGDRGDSVYLVQKGVIRLIHNSLDEQKEIHEEIKRGEFFGVKSSLGHYPREETAQVLTDSNILIFDLKEFENFCLKNVRLVLQMLKVFSSQLRHVHKQVREQLGELNSFENSLEFLRVGEYYYKNNDLSKARYIFDKFTEHYPNSNVHDRAVQLKKAISLGQSYPNNLEPLISNQEISNTIDDIKNNPKNNALKNGSNTEKVSSIFYDGLNLISTDLDTAIQKFEQVIQTINLVSFKETFIIERGHFELSKCYLKKKDFKKTINLASTFIRKYQNSAQTKKILIILAQAFEGQNNITKAMAFYTKVVNLPPKDQDSFFANKSLQKIRKPSL